MSGTGQSLAQSITGSAESEDVCVMDQSVNEGCGEPLIPEHLIPAPELEIGRGDDALLSTPAWGVPKGGADKILDSHLRGRSHPQWQLHPLYWWRAVQSRPPSVSGPITIAPYVHRHGVV